MLGEERWAIDIHAIPDSLLSWPSVRAGIKAATLPRVAAAPRPEDSAVLSWRWDQDLFEGRSRNVALALSHAKRSGLRYLFMDLVSVDQKLKGDLLLREVSGLSKLYRDLNVIAVADRDDTGNWPLEMRRPWMLFEARNYMQNGRQIEFLTAFSDRNPAEELVKIFNTPYSNYVFWTLVKYTGMADPFDFRFIFEPFSQAFELIYNKLRSSTDFVFAVLLFCLLYEEGDMVDRYGTHVNNGMRLPRVGAPDNISEVGLDQFKIGERRESGNVESCYPIKFGDLVVAEWRNKMTSSFDRNWLKALPGADVAFLRALGAGDDLIAAYSSRKTDQLKWLHLEGEPPHINVHVADLQLGRWTS